MGRSETDNSPAEDEGYPKRTAKVCPKGKRARRAALAQVPTTLAIQRYTGASGCLGQRSDSLISDPRADQIDKIVARNIHAWRIARAFTLNGMAGRIGAGPAPAGWIAELFDVPMLVLFDGVICVTKSPIPSGDEAQTRSSECRYIYEERRISNLATQIAGSQERIVVLKRRG
jgi:hypothetical protein